MAKQVYGYKTKRDFDRVDRAVQRIERSEPRPKKGKRPKRGGGGTSVNTDAAIVKLTATMLGATGNPRSPARAESYEVIAGEVSGTIANWSIIQIPNGTYCGVIFIENEWHIWPAFC